MYAILDTETTGGSPADSKITEIAIFLHDGNRIINKFSTLINPETSIPAFITNLTGISNEMVRDAPKFYEIAKDIIEITRDAVFVAHNCAFDYGMVRKEFRELGYDYSRLQLCTVKSSRKVFPGFPSYSLGKLCRSLEIPLNNAHRAEADAEATVRLFEMLYSNVGDEILTHATQNAAYKSSNPLAAEIMPNIPEATGVYYLKNTAGEIIFIHHAKNIRKAIWAHFKSKGSKWAVDLSKNIAEVQYTITGSFLMASFLATMEIHNYQPKFNGFRQRKKQEKKASFQMSIDSNNLVIIDKGSNRDERSVMICYDNEYVRFGLLNFSETQMQLEELNSTLPHQIHIAALHTKIREYLGANKVEKIIPF